MASIRQPSQNRIMRAVRGAVKNASDAHPNWKMDRRFVNSVAKRAAGTLTAEWREGTIPLTPIQRRIIIMTTETAAGCWMTNQTADYGVIKIGGSRVLLHRASYEAFVGPIPSGMLVRHSCDNSQCACPAHLVLGTDLDNSSDRMERGRHRVSPLRGEDSPRAKLDATDVMAIRASEGTNAATAERFNVSESLVQQIRAGKKWRHLLVPVGTEEVLAARLARRQERKVGALLDQFPRWRAGPMLQTRSPLKRLWQNLSILAGQAKRAGDDKRAETLIDVLRIIAAMQGPKK